MYLVMPEVYDTAAVEEVEVKVRTAFSPEHAVMLKHVLENKYGGSFVIYKKQYVTIKLEDDDAPF